MAPFKSLPPAKVALVLKFFRTASVAYTLKDLEKLLPSAAGISSMAVKDYLAFLVGESHLTLEKIGSGNWYWTFPADMRRAKEKALSDARKERDKTRAAVAQLQSELDGLIAEKAVGQDEADALALKERGLRARRDELKEAVESYETSRGHGAGDVEVIKGKVNLYIDNIFALQGYVSEVTGGDSEVLAGLRKELGIEEDLDYVE